MNLTRTSTRDLLSLFAAVMKELRGRGVVRSTNNPVADYAELLCERALALKRKPKSTKGFDATDTEGNRYEVKARRLDTPDASRQLSALRALNEGHFTYLAGVLFDENVRVLKGCLVPHSVVLQRSTFRKHTNAWIFHLKDDLWSVPEVLDITSDLLAAERSLSSGTSDDSDTRQPA